MAMTTPKPLEFKGRMLSMTRATIVTPDLDAIADQVRDFARQMPHVAKGMSVLLDAQEPVAIEPVLAAFRDAGIQVLGVVDGVLTASAQQCGLPVVPEEPRHARAEAGQPSPAQPLQVVVHKPARMITEPIRSGQQIYASDGDLIVVNSVSTGAEIAADGCVHVYGTLRGRAVAGARGDTGARIFCRHFDAELVAIAGVYAVAEQIPGELRKQPVQIRLDHGKLKIEQMDG